MYASLILGEIQNFYYKFWWWDKLLHFGSGIALGFIGFLILYTLKKNKKLNASPLLICLFAFCFSLALGALWEIFEFTGDIVLGTNMQKSGLVDTMWDLIIDAGGALFASFWGYLHLQYNRKGLGLFNYYLESIFKENYN